MPAATTNPTRSTPVTPSAAAGSTSGSTSNGQTDSGTTSSSSSNSGFESNNHNNSSSGSGNMNNSHPAIAVGATVRAVYENVPAAAGQPGNLEFKGEVIAYDPKKVLVLKSNSSCGRNSFNNVHMVNLSLSNCKIQVLSEKKEPLPDLPSLNITRLNNRLRDQVVKKRKQVMAFKSGVTPAGQRLFQAIGKTIDEVTWNGENISVLKEVTIYPPYRPEDVKGNTDSQALKHVRKIVEKHIIDQQQLQHASPSPHQTADPPGQVTGAGASGPSDPASSSGAGGKPASGSTQSGRPRPSSHTNNTRNSSNPSSAYSGGGYSSSHSPHTNKPPFGGSGSNQ